ncbi:MAG: YggS family pyridoxal phosphate-dependent enzyme [Nitrospinae bacterium]|nr:YggS family pyridoxal phosphate-dependent enzyme [Nitrospinota bacterium]
MSSVWERVRETRRRIEMATARAGRAPGSVKLVAVTKNVDLPAMEEALRAGVAAIGESRVQEARAKRQVIGDRVEWHMIGPLQLNKAKYCPGLFTVVHSVDREDLARELDRRARDHGVWQCCLLQVNVGRESQKGGCAPEKAEELLRALAGFDRLRMAGLMTVPPFDEDPERARPFYRELAALRDELNRKGAGREPLAELSMGMSNDFEVAVEEGATLVRVGSAIFGPRPGPLTEDKET